MAAFLERAVDEQRNFPIQTVGNRLDSSRVNADATSQTKLVGLPYNGVACAKSVWEERDAMNEKQPYIDPLPGSIVNL